MPPSQITLDLARSLLTSGSKNVRIPSNVGALFLQALWTASNSGQGLTFDNWCHQLRGLGHNLPDRTAMRRRLAEMEQCFETLGCAWPSPAIWAPTRGATVGPWRLRHDLCERLVVHAVETAAMNDLARLTTKGLDNCTQLQVLHCFLVGDDLARNGMFADAAADMAKALTLSHLSPELKCVLHFRVVKYLRRAGKFAEARSNLAQASLLVSGVDVPMRGHVLTELAVQGWRLK